MVERRRGKGEGSIYQLKDGRWCGSVDLGWHEGGRRRRRTIRKTRAEVSRALRRILTEAESGSINVERPPTLEIWMATYFRDVASTRVRPSTLNGYEPLSRLHIIPHLGPIRIDRLRPQQIADCYRELGASLAPSSIRRVHAVLRRALAVAMRWGLIPNNPALMVDPPAMKRQDIHPYTMDETRTFLRTVSQDRLEARWLIAIMLGLRQGETLGLTWDDIDFDERTLHVRRSLQRQPDGSLALVNTKTERSNRILPMPPAIEAALRERRVAQEEEGRLIGSPLPVPYLVFTTGAGTPVQPRNDYRSFRRLTQKAGLRRTRLHDLRHTAATLLLEQGVAPRVVMEILGHSGIAITMNTYTHVVPELNRCATDLVEQALWPQK